MYKHLQKRARETPPVTLRTLRKMRDDGEPISCITAYDASFAAVVDVAGVDVVLVGDSLGMVIQGHETTVPVTMDDMVYHTRAVTAGNYRPFVIADMPFMSYATPEHALHNAARLMQEGHARMVKLEGGINQLSVVEALSNNEIPICAHLGLTPQSVHKLGGFRVQGREQEQAKQMTVAAQALEQAGADIILLECVPNELGQAITEAVS
ncbi:MAG: 3-methyl-2-oxobutanoate hydroxymethyltransferase, partial [Gammaproteobacteria bacterium]|nr:3-methyl-2-oxobutanoate hydroxymethyltransferase [Gammaproteobacteria bacterium]